jgi:hypothetical protein
MPNHYHLLAQTPRANLSRAIGWLQTTYCIRYNRLHHRGGYLVQGRFKAHLIEADSYAKQLVRYVHLNPVRPRDRRKPVPGDRGPFFEKYLWSSHRAYAGTAGKDQPQWLCAESAELLGRAARPRNQGISGGRGRLLRRTHCQPAGGSAGRSGSWQPVAVEEGEENT